MWPSSLAIVGVVFGWGLVMMSPAFADTSSSSSFILTDSFSIGGGPSDTSTSFTQKGASGFGANPVPPATSSTTTNTRSRSATTPNKTPASVVMETPVVITDPTVLPSEPVPSSSGGTSIIDRVIDALDSARETIIAPFIPPRAPLTVEDIQPTIVAVTPSNERSTGSKNTTAQQPSVGSSGAVETPAAKTTKIISPLDAPTSVNVPIVPSTTEAVVVMTPVTRIRSNVGAVVRTAVSAVRRVTISAAASVATTTIVIAQKTVQVVRTTESWFQRILDAIFSSFKKTETVIQE